MRRSIIWYNPPYSANVRTNVGGIFRDLINTHLHHQHKYHKIFNKNTVKLSYSCMRNVAATIRSHNAALLRKDVDEPPPRMCSCRPGVACPLENRCLDDNIIYEGNVTEVVSRIERPYVGLTSTDWKSRRGVHNQGFNHRKYANRCELSKHIWTLKDSSIDYSLTWRILQKVRGRLIAGACKLCTAEKMHIVRHPNQTGLLNSNWVQKCPHEWKYVLSYYGDNQVRNDTMD